MIEKYIKPILDHKVDLQERIFRLVTGIEMIALALTLLGGIFIGENIESLVVLSGCMILVAVVVSYSISRKRINLGATLAGIVLLIFFPLNFFASGGMYGGASLWMVFLFVYVSMTLCGVRRIILFLCCIAETVLCYYLDFIHPEYVLVHTVKAAHTDLALAAILVGGLTSIMILFQNHIYQEENRISNQQKQEIEELSKAENHFFSSMSHEIRTPINTIIGLNEMILRSDVSEDVAENARNIQGAGKMLLTIINDILDMSKIESGKMEIVRVTYETGVFFSDIINMIWIKAQEKNLEFHLDIDSSIPSQLCGDEVRIKQILINLLNNAIKYTSEGAVTLSVRCERRGMNRVRVYYSVKDTGMGVKQEDIPHLFSAFKRVDEEKNRYVEGTGLGLSIVKQLVDLMGGEINVNSVYTKGTTFLVTLDQDIIEERELGVFTLESRTGIGGRMQYRQSFEAPQAQILIVDDNEMNLMVAQKLLADTKIQIDTASSGAECLKYTLMKHYDGILMDHMMPEMDGIACFHAIRTQPAGLCRKTPVVALTANAGSVNQFLYKKEGFNGYLAKPVSGALLEAAVLNILPRELVSSSEDAVRPEIGSSVLMFDQGKRASLMITTDSVADIPEEILNRMAISVLPYYVCTDYGRFLDGSELNADDLLLYLSEGNRGTSKAPDVQDYVSFFAQKLTEAQNIVHISMAQYASEGYRHALEAAKSFENVTVLDSGHLSSGLGISVLHAAHFASLNASREEIIQQVEYMKERISTSFIMGNTRMLYQGGRISRGVYVLCEKLLLHPVIKLNKSKMKAGGMMMGGFARVAKKYIRKTLKNESDIDKSVVFLTHSGMSSQHLQEIKRMVQKQCPFERIYVQKASAAISCNCGPDSFGLLFMKN
ncbi:DegV family protein [Lachnospiraceae bacterium 45-W7]